MRRHIDETLAAWKNQERRKPLLLRGARQVGKTWSVRAFAETHFGGRIHVLDFEREPSLRRLFEADLDPARIIDALRVTRATPIEPGRDLLFFDEVQACPRAIVSLRYFFEEMPGLHVIAAGSLLEFALGALSFPVGRVRTVTLHPMTFVEFLWALGADRAAEVVAAGPASTDPRLHEALLEHLRAYLLVGGMPEAVATYQVTGALSDAFLVHDDLIHAYRRDFSKYSPRADASCLETVLTGAAQAVGKATKYRHLAPGFGDHAIRDAYDLLVKARVLRRVRSASPAGLPLGASASARRFKTLLLDVGLLQRLSGTLVPHDALAGTLLGMYQGSLAEQFVGQELAAALHDEVYCWMREARNSSAEVDYLIALEGRVQPIEVKSGPAGRLRSLHILLGEYPQCAPGIVLSEAPYAELPAQRLVFVPLYYAGALTGGALDVT
jgi:predicted AAA+ superfamily ATPase